MKLLSGLAVAVALAAPELRGQIFFRPKEIDTVLLNPGMGFTTFQRFNGDETFTGTNWTEGLPIDYAAKPPRPGFRNEGHPQTTIAYWRVYWRYLEPEEGRYRWDLLDRALATARARGQSLMLRVAAYGGGEKVVEDERYRQRWTRFITALARRYDGHPDLESVDVALTGPWGEGGSAKLPQPVLTAMLDAYLDGFRSTPLLMQLISPWANRYALSKRPSGVGWRADCLGDYKPKGMGSWTHMIDGYPRDVIEMGVADAWKQAPVSFEACWVMQHWKEQKWDLDLIIEQSLKWHISSFNNKSSRVPPEWNAKVDGWLKRMGYRLVPRKVSMPSTVRIGETFALQSLWENKGVAPCYRPYVMALRVGGNVGPVILTKGDVRKWLPGDSIYDEALTLPAGLAPGVHEVSLGIVDPATKSPKVQLGIAGRTPDGWYPMGRLEVLPPKTLLESLKAGVRKRLP